MQTLRCSCGGLVSARVVPLARQRIPGQTEWECARCGAVTPQERRDPLVSRCLVCARPFRLRRGGVPKRYCSQECRKEQQRRVARLAYLEQKVGDHAAL